MRIHIKQNILCYMRAIWNIEDRDPRYFELHSVRAPLPAHEAHPMTARRGRGRH